MNIKALEDFLGSVPEGACPLISISDCIAWAVRDEDSVIWVSWNNGKKEYLEGYECELPEGFTTGGEYTIMNCDTGCGNWQTEIFLNESKMGIDDLYDKYEGAF